MKSKYLGMTVNERLYLSGLMTDFDFYLKQKDVEKIINVLRKIELEESSISEIMNSLGLSI